MKDIRIDSMTGSLVIYSSFRNKRPHDNKKKVPEIVEKESYSKTCPFCKGNEHMCGESLDEIIVDGEWKAKSVFNKFPILDMSTDEIFGQHEVVVESDKHNANYFNMDRGDFENVLNMYKMRTRDLKEVEGIAYVNIFKNSGSNSGASLDHPHSQIISMNIIPPELEKEIRVAEDFYEDVDENLYEYIIDEEQKNKTRIIKDSKFFIAYVPYACRYSGEIRIIQKTDLAISDWDDEHIEDLAYMLEGVFSKWFAYHGEISFNMLVHNYPLDRDYRPIFRNHIHIIPRKYNFGGFELSTDLFVCGVDPEELASELRFD